MAVDPETARRLALSLPGASEAPHMERTAFRTTRKIFATLGTGRDLNLMFDPDRRDAHCDMDPGAFRPLPGGWGRMGVTRCDLDAVDEPTLLSALVEAHRLAAPRPRRR